MSNRDINISCPICGEKLKDYGFAYDNNQYGKRYLRCDTCGHKQLDKVEEKQS